MTTHHYHVFETQLGPIGLAWSGEGLSRVQLPDRDAAQTGRRIAQRTRSEPWSGALPEEVATTLADLQRYAAGEPVPFAGVKLCYEGIPDFNASVYRALCQVKWGETTTYGTLANAVGEPGAARAVGVAMGRNPWPIIVPCHRVLAAQKKIGGFSAPGGATTKEALLRLEGSTWSGDTRDAPLLPGLLS